MLNIELEYAINNAIDDAKAEKHSYQTLEQLLLTLFGLEPIIILMKRYELDIEKVQEELQRYVKENTEALNAEPQDDEERAQTESALAFQIVFQRAEFYAQSNRKKEVSATDLFYAIFCDRRAKLINCSFGMGNS